MGSACRHAAFKPHRQAARELAARYTAGNGVPKSATPAAFWNQVAANQGDVAAMRDLAIA